MIAYNPLWLNNLLIREQANDWYQQKCLDKATCELINNKYLVPFYSPNFFIRIGLFILTVVIFLFSFGLIGLLFLNSIEKSFGGMAIFFALLSYAALEYMVQVKKHFQSGVDDALIWIAASAMVGGISLLANADDIGNSMIVFIVSVYFCLRFADRLMGIVSFISLLAIVFFTGIKLAPLATSFIPFLLMLISIVIYLFTKRIASLHINHLYFNCLQAISITALICLYFSVNYYFVIELINSSDNIGMAEKPGSFSRWLFWFFTVMIPLFYIARGIQKKDIILIRVGLLLVAAIVFTVRFYYSVASIEVVMTMAGILLILIAYGFTRYLTIPKYGFTSMEITKAGTNEKLNFESILLAQTLAGQTGTTDAGTQFKGGDFGGGGASGEF